MFTNFLDFLETISGINYLKKTRRRIVETWDGSCQEIRIQNVTVACYFQLDLSHSIKTLIQSLGFKNYWSYVRLCLINN